MNKELDFPFDIVNQVTKNKDHLLSDFPDFKCDEVFSCNKCKTQNDFKIEFFKSGQPLEQLFKTNGLISKEKLIENKIARLPLKGQNHLGELTLWQVPANFLYKKCDNCDSKYIIVFGMGEIQPGRDSFQISGIWEIKKQ
jgi:hypothetical protein